MNQDVLRLHETPVSDPVPPAEPPAPVPPVDPDQPVPVTEPPPQQPPLRMNA